MDPSLSRTSTDSCVYSQLISCKENALLFTLLGPNCSLPICLISKTTLKQCLISCLARKKRAEATGVAQLYEARLEPGDQRVIWRFKDCGVVCLVKDQVLRSFFLRLYNVKRGRLLWEQELYTTFKYSVSRPFFHTFPADDCQAALNFADEDEAKRFHFAVDRRVNHAQEAGHGALAPHPQKTQTECPDSTLNRHMVNVGRATDKGFDLVRISSVEVQPPCKPLTLREPGQSQSLSEPPPATLSRSPVSRSLWGRRKGPLPPLPTQSGTLERRTPLFLSHSVNQMDFQNLPQKVSLSDLPFNYDVIPPPPSVSAPKLHLFASTSCPAVPPALGAETIGGAWVTLGNSSRSVSQSKKGYCSSAIVPSRILTTGKKAPESCHSVLRHEVDNTQNSGWDSDDGQWL